MLRSARTVALLSALLLTAACRTATPTVAPAPGAAAAAPAEYCPQVSLREGTGTLQDREGQTLRSTASIASTTSQCAVVDGQLTVQVTVSGTVTPGAGAAGGSASLPVRVAVVRGTSVLYSALGRQEVTLQPGGAPIAFTYVDRAVRFPVPTGRDIVIYAGFDEMS